MPGFPEHAAPTLPWEVNWAEPPRLPRAQRRAFWRAGPVPSLYNEKNRAWGLAGQLKAEREGEVAVWRGGLGPDHPGPAAGPHEDKKKPLKAFKPAWGDLIESELYKPQAEKPQTEAAERGPRWMQGASSALPEAQARDNSVWTGLETDIWDAPV